MVEQRFVVGAVPERFVEVDAARLLLILDRFAVAIDEQTQQLVCFPHHGVERSFTPEYYLHKLDFLVRYPGYLAYEFIELQRLGVAIQGRDETMDLVRAVLREREPELMTVPFRRFWRGAYERLDDVEAWWYARQLVIHGPGAQGGASRPRKHYFLTPLAKMEAKRLVANVEHAHWYAERIDLIHRFFGGLSAARVKELQYGHEPYRQAQLNEIIPDLPPAEIARSFAHVFGEPLEVSLD